MKNTNHSNIQAKMFDFALAELVLNQRNSFQPIWSVDSWVKFLIWMSLNCGLPGDRENLQTFADALGPTLTVRMRKMFFERVLDSFSLHVIGDPSESKVLVMPIDVDIPLTNQKVKEALESVGLTPKVKNDCSKWEIHDRLIAIPWNS